MTDRGEPLHRIAAIRLSIGLVQGGALLLLHWAARSAHWPATDKAVFEPLLMAAIFVPFLALAGVGHVRPRTLTLWLAAAAILCVGLGWYWIYRHAVESRYYYSTWFDFYPTLIGILFVTHALVAAADADRRLIAGPATYFDVSLRLVASVTFAGLFVGLLWAILWASAGLFDLIGIETVGILIKRGWFWIPITTIAASTAFHLTDDRTGMVRNVVKPLLTSLSWLLLPAVAIGLAFLAALPFTGLEPLWNTKHATSSLLSAAIVLILLIRCHYQDGEPDTGWARTLVYARLLAVFILVPLVVLTGVGLGLRVEQHGWTPPRLAALACLIVVVCHAAGYSLVAIRSGGTLRGLASVNAVAAFVAVGLLIALSSPIADPARLSVADQVSRLETGKVAADQFDYTMLASWGVRYGKAALEHLKAKKDGPDASYIATQAAITLENSY